jgi:hypothetical protein
MADMLSHHDSTAQNGQNYFSAYVIDGIYDEGQRRKEKQQLRTESKCSQCFFTRSKYGTYHKVRPFLLKEKHERCLEKLPEECLDLS